MRGKLLQVAGVFALLSLSLFLNAQDNFLPGYVIHKTGDTLQGEIHYPGWENSPELIRFRRSAESPEQMLAPLDIKRFSVSGEKYLSAVVEAESSPMELQDYNDDPTFHFRTDTVFLLELVSGDKSLYLFDDRFGRENFYIGKEDGYELLLYKEYIKVHDDYYKHHVKAENSKFKGQLILYLEDCPEIRNYVEEAKYTANSLIKVFRIYASCADSPLQITENQRGVVVKPAIVAGISLTSFNMTGDHEFASLDIPGSTDFSAGIALDIIFRGNQKKWSLYTELLRSAYSFKTEYQEYSNPDNFSDYEMEIAINYLKSNNMARITIPAGAVFVFANAGLSFGIAISYTNKLTEHRYFWGNEFTNSDYALAPFRKIELGGLAGAGVRFKRFSLEGRFEAGDGFSNQKTLKVRPNRLYVLLGYRF